MNRAEQLATRLAGILADIDPYWDTLDLAVITESLKEDPLATVEFLMDAVEGLMA